MADARSAPKSLSTSDAVRICQRPSTARTVTAVGSKVTRSSLRLLMRVSRCRAASAGRGGPRVSGRPARGRWAARSRGRPAAGQRPGRRRRSLTGPQEPGGAWRSLLAGGLASVVGSRALSDSKIDWRNPKRAGRSYLLSLSLPPTIQMAYLPTPPVIPPASPDSEDPPLANPRLSLAFPPRRRRPVCATVFADVYPKAPPPPDTVALPKPADVKALAVYPAKVALNGLRRRRPAGRHRDAERRPAPGPHRRRRIRGRRRQGRPRAPPAAGSCRWPTARPRSSPRTATRASKVPVAVKHARRQPADQLRQPDRADLHQARLQLAAAATARRAGRTASGCRCSASSRSSTTRRSSRKPAAAGCSRPPRTPACC